MNVMATTAGHLVAFGLDTVGIGLTPLALLLVVLLLTLISALVLGGFSQIAAKFVDHQWPANEPLTPAELLWGETGSYVGKTFPGLDSVIAQDLTQYISSKKFAAGEPIFEAGDLPTEFIVIKSGDVEVLDPRQPAPVAAKAGASFGGEAILRREPHPFTIRAKGAVEILALPAEDYLAGLVLGAQRGDDRFVLNQLGTYLAEPGFGMHDPSGSKPKSKPESSPRQSPAPQASAPQGPGQQGPGQQGPGQQGPGQQGPGQQVPAQVNPLQLWPSATHQVGFGAIPGFALPADRAPNRTLPAATLLAAYEQLPGWLHVRSIDGWDGWVADSGLIRLR
jgi:Cyclic nucleotide-binding domain